MGGYIGYDKSKGEWLKYWTLMWEKKNIAITQTAEKHSLKSNTTVVCEIQSECIFLLQRKKQGFGSIKQVPDRNWTEIIRPK